MALDKARGRGRVAGPIASGDRLGLPQALAIRERQPADDVEAQQAIAAQARATVEEALVDLDSMRSREGDHLRADLDSRRTYVADLVERIATAADQGRAAIEQRIADRVRELRTELQADENAVAQEIVRMASRSDITEEVERFRTHVLHWGARCQRGAVRPQARLAPGDEPQVNDGAEADGLRVSELIIAAKWSPKNARAVINVEMRPWGSCSSSRRRGAGKDDAGRAAGR